MPKRPPSGAHTESTSGRTWIDWTPSRLKLAERQADGGNFRLATELCDAMLADDRVSGVLNVRAKGLLGLDLTFEPGAGRRKRGAVKFLEAQEDWDTAYPVEQLGQLNLWGILLGVGVAQNLWTTRPRTGRVVPVADPWHPRHLRFDTQRAQWFIQTADAGEIQIAPGDGQWILYTPGGSKRPTSHGCWRAIARWWLLKHYAQSDWGRHGQNAAGYRVVTEQVPNPNEIADGFETARIANREQLAADIRDLAGRAGITLPPGFDLKIISQPANNHATFKDQIDASNAGIAIAIAGQNLTSEVKGGSFAAAEALKSVANVLLTADGSTLASCIHDQALVFWSEFNLGDRSHAPWPYWDTTPPADLALIAQTQTNAAAAAQAWQAQLDAAAMRNPDAKRFDVDIEEMARTFGLPVIERTQVAAVETKGIELFAYDQENGIATVNEVRAAKGLPPIEGGDISTTQWKAQQLAIAMAKYGPPSGSGTPPASVGQ